MAVRGGWRPLSGLICEIVNSVGQGNFTFVREKSGKSQGISNTYGCGNHVPEDQAIMDAIGKACHLPNVHAKIDSTSTKNMGDNFTKITIFIICEGSFLV